uniref:Poly(A) polymerase RNA-binding domain-containing protein n=1 Tax=Chenopodium quinoa TaxID=63459 RepID=A0A803NC16_CHEQI
MQYQVCWFLEFLGPLPQWRWPNPVMLCDIEEEELGFPDIDVNKACWGSLFEPYFFFESYKIHLQVDIIAADADDLRSWKGWVESRFRQLTLMNVILLGNCSAIPVHMTCLIHLGKGLIVHFLWVWKGRNHFDIRATVDEFRNSINMYSYWKPGMDIYVSHVRKNCFQLLFFHKDISVFDYQDVSGEPGKQRSLSPCGASVSPDSVHHNSRSPLPECDVTPVVDRGSPPRMVSGYVSTNKNVVLDHDAKYFGLANSSSTVSVAEKSDIPSTSTCSAVSTLTSNEVFRDLDSKPKANQLYEGLDLFGILFYEHSTEVFKVNTLSVIGVVFQNFFLRCMQVSVSLVELFEVPDRFIELIELVACP